jgi:hypothetical protein
MGKKVMVFVGTQKGGFIFESNEKRKKWQVSDIQFKSWNVMQSSDPRAAACGDDHLCMDPPPITQMISAKRGRRRNRCRCSRAHHRPAGTVDEAFRSEGGESVTTLRNEQGLEHQAWARGAGCVRRGAQPAPYLYLVIAVRRGD